MAHRHHLLITTAVWMTCLVFGSPVNKLAADATPAPRCTPAERRQRLVEIQKGIARSVAGLERRLKRPNAVVPSRDLTNLALFKLVTGAHPGQAEQLLFQVFEQQDMDPRSPAYGSLPWLIGSSEVADENALEFGTQALGPILLEYGKRLSPEFHKELRPHIQAALVALQRRSFRMPSYTNAFLMKTVNLILLGEAVGDRGAADKGYAELDRWIAYTQSSGIHEFDSATYYAVDLDSLGAGYLYATRAGARDRFKAVLDYFWTDIAANCFHGRLAGPQSRSYDFIRGAGGLDVFLYAEGLKQALSIGKLDFERTYLLVNSRENGYHPGQRILDLAVLPERMVRQQWDARPGADRCEYLTEEFAIGSSSGNYSPQDKLLAVDLASTRNLPQISVVPDPFDEPYGKHKTKDRSGHDKPKHWPLNVTAIQDKSALLFLLDLDPKKEEKTTSLATNVLLPAQADQLVLDGRPVSTSEVFTLPTHKDALIGIREGQTGVAIRIFRADGCADQEPLFVLKGDAAGLREGVARLAVYHYQGAERKLGPGHIRIGLLVLADRCCNDREFSELLRTVQTVPVEERTDANLWKVKARVGQVLLEAGRDLRKQRILYRRVNGREVDTSRLSVNGVDLAAPIWKSLAER